MEPVFSIGDSLRFGWHKVREHSGIVFQFVLVLLVLTIVRAILQTAYPHAVSAWIIIAIIYVAQVVFGVGITIIVLKLSRGEAATVRDIVPPWRLFWRSMLASLVVALMMLFIVAAATLIAALGILVLAPISKVAAIGVAVIVCIAAFAAFVWVILRYSAVKYLAIDLTQVPATGLQIGSILRKSAVMTMGVKWRLGRFGIVIILINILGAILLLIGLLISIPVSMFAGAYVYLKLLARAGESVVAAPPSTSVSAISSETIPPSVPPAVE